MEINMEPNELVPLEGNQPLRPRLRTNRQMSRYSARCYQAPLRVFKMVMLLVLLPCVFIMVPLYMRYRVFQSQMYPMGMTDMRLIDGKISPIWCQRQVVKSNSTFNAFVVPGAPSIAEELVPVSMVRELSLEDDMKEYWGFYLLQGSTVTVAACVRRPGASLIMIKGYKHLKDCAYIGDDSSEEIDELEKAMNESKITEEQYNEGLKRLMLNNLNSPKANSPGTMKRQKAGVSFLDPSQSGDVSPSGDTSSVGDITDHDPKELRDILEKLHAMRQAAKDEKAKYYHPPKNIEPIREFQHRYRDVNVDKEERRWLSFKGIEGNSTDMNSTENFPTERRVNVEKNSIPNENDLKKDENSNNDSRNTITERSRMLINNHETASVVDKNAKGSKNTKMVINSKLETESTTKTLETKISTENDKSVEIKVDENGEKTSMTEILNDEDGDIQIEVLNEDENKFVTSDENISARDNSSEINSKEVFEEVLSRLQSLGDKGKRVLMKLHKAMGAGDQKTPQSWSKSKIMSKLTGSDEELDRLRKVLVEAIDEEKTRAQRQEKRRKAFAEARTKREIYLQESLNEDDEAANVAAEEGLEDQNPDGYAEDHTKFNESSPLDMSRSEFWSSFSSSEERLLECEGLILNLPLSPSVECESDRSEGVRLQAAQRNAVTYRVPANGYYFFVFNSENEIDVNYISVRFDLQKTRYDIARSALRECRNTTEPCKLLLDIFSSQRVVLELPLRDNTSLWNEQFVVFSECEPRTSIYLTCVIAVPVLILLFAFQ